MPLLTFACPACQKVLKSFSPIAAGTRVKCPTCGASFAMTAQDAARAAVPSENGAPLPPPAVARRPKSRALLVGAAALLLLAALAAGAYFLFSGGVVGGRHEEDPLAYLPPGTELVAGIDAPALLDDPLLGPAIEAAVREQAGAGDFLDRCAKETGLDTREMLGHTLLAGKIDVLDALAAAMPGAAADTRPSPVTLIVKPSRSFDAQQIVRAAGDAKRRTSHGKTYYEVSVGAMRTLYMPSDHVIVLSALPASELDAVFASDGTKPSLSADAVALVRGVESHPCWAVVPFEGTARTRLEGAARGDFRSLVEALLKAKGLAVWGGADGERLRFGAEVPCANDRGAVRVAAEAESAWKKEKAELDPMAVLLFFLPKTGRAYREFTGSVKFAADGTTARGSADVSRQALADATEELQQDRQAGGLLGGFPGIVPKPVLPRKPK